MYTDEQFQKAARIWRDYIAAQRPSEPVPMSPTIAFRGPKLEGSSPDNPNAAPTVEYLREISAIQLTKDGYGCSAEGKNRDWVIKKRNINAGNGTYISIKHAGNDKPEMVLQDDGRIQWELSGSERMEISYQGQASPGYKTVNEPFYGEGSFNVRYCSRLLLVPVKKGENYVWRTPGREGGPPRDMELSEDADTVLIVTATSASDSINMKDFTERSPRIAAVMPASYYGGQLTADSTPAEIDEFLRHYHGDDIVIKDQNGFKEVEIYHPAKRAYIAQEDIQWGFGWKNVKAKAGDMIIKDGDLAGHLVISKEDLAAGKHRSFIRVADEPAAPIKALRMDFHHS